MIEEILHTIASAGAESLETLWFPVLLWIALSAVSLALLYLFRQKIRLLYHYHLLSAVLISLPAGIAIARLIEQINDMGSTANEAIFSIIVVQSPLTVSAPVNTEPAASSPDTLPLLLGLGLFTLAAVSFIKIIRMAWDRYQLGAWTKKHISTPLTAIEPISESNRMLAGSMYFKPAVCFSNTMDVPCTFGLFKPVIALPGGLRSNPEKLNMALRHELLHLQRGDYLLNLLLVAVKKLFWFVPPVHPLYRQIKIYREISCDNAVLADTQISTKGYAELLFELAPHSNPFQQTALSMSLESSILKKRIKTMENRKHEYQSTRRSLSYLFIVFLAITTVMACSDMQNNTSVNEEELSEIQSQIEDEGGQLNLKGSVNIDLPPLYIVDGEEIETKDESESALGELDPKSIASIEVLRGEDAVDTYGEKAREGVVIITTKESVDTKNMETSSSEEYEDFFRVVENMPEIVGGEQALKDCLEYPSRAQRAGIEGTVSVELIVTKQGEVKDATILRGVESLNEEALRCINAMDFEPGLQRGEQVPVKLVYPVVFQLPDSE